MPEPINPDADAQRPPQGETPPRRTPPRAQSSTNGKGKAKPVEQERQPVRRRTAQDNAAREALVGIYTMGGAALAASAVAREDHPLAAAGMNVIGNAERVADAWMDLADRNPRIRAMLHKLSEGSAIGTLVGLHVSMAMPVLAAKGLVPPQVAIMFGAAEDPTN